MKRKEIDGNGNGMDSTTEFLRKLSETFPFQNDDNYYSNSGIWEEHIARVMNSQLRQVRYPNFSDDDIRKFINFVLRLTGIPKDLKGAILLENSLNYLIFNFCRDVDVPLRVIKQLFYIMKDWFHVLKQSPKAKNVYAKRPAIEEAPLLRFHVDACNDSKNNNEPLPQFYKSYAYMIHKAIGFNLQQEVAPETHQAYIRSARYFFKYMPLDVKRKKTHPPAISEDYISWFARGYDLAIFANEDGELTSAAQDHLNNFTKLLGYDPIKPKPHGGHAGGKRRISERKGKDILRRSTADGHVKVLSTEGSLPVIDHVRYSTREEPGCELEKEAEQFEATDAVDAYEVPQDDLSRRPSIPNKWVDLINLRNFQFWFDSDYMNFFHQGILHSVLKKKWGNSQVFNCIIVYLYILAHTGIHHRKLLDLTVAGDHSNKDQIALRSLSGRHYIVMPMFAKLRTLDYKECLPTSSQIWIPIPDNIGDLLPYIVTINEGYVFRYVDDRAKIRRLNLEDIAIFLEEEVDNACQQYNLRITPSRIRRSFFPLYHSRFGLDPLIGACVSGEDHGLYKSQIHYTRIDHNRLEKDYLSVFSKVISAILQNYNESVSQGFMEGVPMDSLFPVVCADRGKIDDKADNLDFPGYGSPLICNVDFTSQMIKAIAEAIIAEDNLLRRHNLYTIYSYLCAQFSFALRPRNNPDIRWVDLNEHLGTLVVSDKQSQKYHEVRVLSAPQVLKSLLECLRQGFAELRSYIARYIDPSALKVKQDKIFFFVDLTGKFVSFTLKRMRELLHEIGVQYDLPMNLPRHFVRNYLYHGEMSNDLIDWRTGHQHDAREVFNITSTVFLKEPSRICLRGIDELLEKIGFIPLKYIS